MGKTAILFAGQGAQVVGMGKDLSEKFPTAQALFQKADDILGYNLSKIIFEGPEEDLTRTEHAQPAIFLISWIAFSLLNELAPQLSYEATAGLSLGELTALTAADVFSFEEGLKLVHKRGIYMQEACEETQGGMAAVIGLDTELVRRYGLRFSFSEGNRQQHRRAPWSPKLPVREPRWKQEPHRSRGF